MDAVVEATVPFEALFGTLKQLKLDAQQVARLRAWLATLKSAASCLALIEAAAGRRPR